MRKKLLWLVLVVLLLAQSSVTPTVAQTSCPYWDGRCNYYHQQHLYYMQLWEMYTGGYGEWEYYWLYEIAQQYKEMEGDACNLADMYCNGY